MGMMAATTRRQEEPPPPRSVDSRDLLNGARKLFIRHDGETYTLQLTRQGKLLLTK